MSRLNAVNGRCVAGHPLEGDNVYVSTSGGRIQRLCRQCRRDRYNARSQRRAELVPELEPAQIRRLKSDYDDGIAMRDLASRCGVHEARLRVLLGVGA